MSSSISAWDVALVAPRRGSGAAAHDGEGDRVRDLGEVQTREGHHPLLVNAPRGGVAGGVRGEPGAAPVAQQLESRLDDAGRDGLARSTTHEPSDHASGAREAQDADGHDHDRHHELDQCKTPGGTVAAALARNSGSACHRVHPFVEMRPIPITHTESLTSCLLSTIGSAPPTPPGISPRGSNSMVVGSDGVDTVTPCWARMSVD